MSFFFRGGKATTPVVGGLLQQLEALLSPWTSDNAEELVNILYVASPRFAKDEKDILGKEGGKANVSDTLLYKLQKANLRLMGPQAIVALWQIIIQVNLAFTGTTTGLALTSEQDKAGMALARAQIGGFLVVVYDAVQNVLDLLNSPDSAVSTSAVKRIINTWKDKVVDVLDSPASTESVESLVGFAMNDARVELLFLFAILEQWLLPATIARAPAEYTGLDAWRDWLDHRGDDAAKKVPSGLFDSETHAVRRDNDNTFLVSRLRELSATGDTEAGTAYQDVVHFMATPTSQYEERQKYMQQAINSLPLVCRRVPELSDPMTQWIVSASAEQ